MKNRLFKIYVVIFLLMAIYGLNTSTSFAQYCGSGSWSCCVEVTYYCTNIAGETCSRANDPTCTCVAGCSRLSGGSCSIGCGSPCSGGGLTGSVCAGADPPPPPPPGGPLPPPPPPTYDVTGRLFKDNNFNNSFGTGDIGVSGKNITMSTYSTTTNSVGQYGFNGFLEGNYTVTSTDTVCGWYYPNGNSVAVSLFGGDKTANFPLRPNPLGNLTINKFELRNAAGQNGPFDPGETVYPYVELKNNGTTEPYSPIGRIYGGIRKYDPTNVVFTQSATLGEASEPNDFYFQRNLCWGGGTNYSTNGNPSADQNFNHWKNTSNFVVPSSPGLYTARLFVDPEDTVNEGPGQGPEFDDNQAAFPYTVREYSISGTVFEDENSNGNKDIGESNYTGTLSANSFTDTNGTSPTISGATFTYSNRIAGGHTITFTPPPGYKLSPNTNDYFITLENGGFTALPCTSTLPQGPACASATSTNVTNVNFGITKSEAWIQAYGLNARFDEGLPMAKIPTTTVDSSYGAFAMKPFGTSLKAPGILFYGKDNVNLTSGAVSSTPWDWKAGGSTDAGYSDIYNPTLFPLRTSYSYLSNKLKDTAVELSAAPGGCPATSYTNCTLNPTTFRPGTYKVSSSNLHLNTYNFVQQSGEPATPKDYIFLVDGNLAVKGVMRVASNRTLLFSVKNTISFQNYVGRIPAINIPSTDPAGDHGGVAGFYVADGNIRLNTYGDCAKQAADSTADKQLFVDGALIVDADGNGGSLNNQRTLCTGNLEYPTLIVRPRLDMLLSTPDTIRQSGYTWQEVAP